MSQTIAEALKAEGRAEGKAEGMTAGRLDTAREWLRELLEERFQALPESLIQRIQGTTDLARLKAAARSVHQLRSVDELQL